MRVGVLGGTRGVGRALVSQLIEFGHQITVLARDPLRLDMVSDSLTVEQGDARDKAAVVSLATGQDAVCSCLGVVPSRRPVTLFSESTAHLLDAVKGRADTRIMAITGVGAGDSRGHGGFFYDRLVLPLLLKKMYEDKDRLERMLVASEANWTIVRPGFLTNGSGTGEYRMLTELEGVRLGRISRADVAHFMASELDSPGYEREVVNLCY